MILTRRHFLAASGVSLVLALEACGSDDGSTSIVMAGSTTPAPQPAPTPTTSPVATVHSTRLILWGDSRTQGVGAVSPMDFAGFVAAMLPTLTITNAGISGQTAAQVVARQGGEPTLLTMANNVIAPSGPTTVTAATVDIFFFSGTPMVAGSFTGTMAGVPGHMPATVRVT